MEAVYPAAASALARGRRRRRPEPRLRHRTMPVTFAEIKEVDEEQDSCEDGHVNSPADRRRKPDELLELSREFAEFRRRRARRTALRELDELGVDVPPDNGSPTANARCNTEAEVVVNAPAELSDTPKTRTLLTRAASEPT